jgi:imidazolonepropionase-like amidohydrolase
MDMMRTLVTGLTGLALLTGCTSWDTGQQELVENAGSAITALTHFTLIDGTGSPAVDDAALLIRDGQISWVGQSSGLDVPEGAKIHDLTGKFVMPGLIDNHVHLGRVHGLELDDRHYTTENVRNQLELYAAYGVTAVQSLGTDETVTFQVRENARNGPGSMARVFTSGLGVVYDGGYGGLPGLRQRVSTAEEARELVAAQKAQGADVIKLWLDDGFGDIPQLMPYDISKAVIDEAHKNGLKVVAHIYYLDHARELMKQGLDAYGHEVRDTPINVAFVADMKQNGVWQMAATLSREAGFAYARLPFLDDPFFLRGVRPDVVAELKSAEHEISTAAAPHFTEYYGAFQNAMTNFGLQAKAGVRYGMGSDSGLGLRFPGYAAHWELALMVEAGISPLDAITAATGGNAEFMGATQIGTIQPGKLADLLVLRSNPLQDIRNTRAIERVYIGGNPVPTIWQTCVGRHSNDC